MCVFVYVYVCVAVLVLFDASKKHKGVGTGDGARSESQDRLQFPENSQLLCACGAPDRMLVPAAYSTLNPQPLASPPRTHAHLHSVLAQLLVLRHQRHVPGG